MTRKTRCSIIGIAGIIILVALSFQALSSLRDAHYSSRRKGHIEALQAIARTDPSGKDLVAVMGPPFKILPIEETTSMARNWSHNFNLPAAAGEHGTRTLIYLVNDLVYLLYLDPNDQLIDFTVLYN